MSHKTFNFFAVLLMWAAAACTCDSKLRGKNECSTDADCKCHFGEAYTCVKSSCQPAPQLCKSNGDCCPGQVCNDFGRCSNNITECENDADCSAKLGTYNGQVCVMDDSQRVKICKYVPCDSSGACANGLSCYGRGMQGYDTGFCLMNAPCNGGCPVGQLCVIADDSCYTPPENATCGSCEPGFQAVLSDPKNVFSACHLQNQTGTYKGTQCSAKGVACACGELPALLSLDFGRYSSIQKSGGTVYVSTYDGSYGDLVLLTMGADGKQVGPSDYVDGLPSNGHIGAAPSGPRGGIVEKGDDVGRFTAMVLARDTKEPRIAYYDATNTALKFAARSGKTWKIHTVDNKGDVGLYTNMVADLQDNPTIFYFQKADAAGAAITGLKIARARMPVPQSASDWDIATIESIASVPKTNTLVDIPSGTGLWPSGGYLQGMPIVAYYDSIKSVLKAAFISGSSWSIVTLDEKGGRFPSLSTADNSVAIAYASADGKSRFYLGSNLVRDPARISIIDDGVRDPAKDGRAITGADMSLIGLGSGNYYVGYQDQTAGDLVVRKRDPASGAWSSVMTAGKDESLGYYTRLAVADGKGYAIHVHSKTIMATGGPGIHNTLRLDMFNAP